MEKCLSFAREYAHWTVNDWKNVIFLDKNKIYLICSDGRNCIHCSINAHY